MIHREIDLDIPDSTLKSWQETLDLLASLIGIPAALIMRLRAPHIEVFVSSAGEGNPYHPGDQEEVWGSGLYCETVLKTQEQLLVPDATGDEVWKDNPDIKLGMISYLGLPLVLPDGNLFGTICVLDTKPNAYSEDTEKVMSKFRSLLESHLELLYVNQILGDTDKRMIDYLEELQTLRGVISICSYCKGIKDAGGEWHPVEHYLIDHPGADFSHGICPVCLEKENPEPRGENR